MQGGLILQAHKHQSVTTPIDVATVPHIVRLATRIEHSEPLVKPDADIFIGQPIAYVKSPMNETAQPLHASVSGRLQTMETQINPLTNNNELVFVIENDGLERQHQSLHPIDNFETLTATQLQTHIEAANILGMGGANFPTAIKLSAAASHNVSVLIINGAECEPFITCDDALMREFASDIVLGTRALLHASTASAAIIAIEANKPVAIQAMQAAVKLTNDSRLSVKVVPAFYPAGGERQLITLITGKEVPSGGIPPDIGILCQNVGTAAAIATFLRTGEPLISRIVTITGSGVKTPRNLRVRFGTPIASVINDCGGYTDCVERLIMGGSMMGIALPDDAITVSAATNCIIAATTRDLQPRGVEMPCIRCGNCSQACPANLLPQQLLRYAKLNDRSALKALGLQDCIECGCCDYVCPSHIPLTARLVAAKSG